MKFIKYLIIGLIVIGALTFGLFQISILQKQLNLIAKELIKMILQ